MQLMVWYLQQSQTQQYPALIYLLILPTPMTAQPDSSLKPVLTEYIIYGIITIVNSESAKSKSVKAMMSLTPIVLIMTLTAMLHQLM